jgi:hypothetical protein
MMTDLEQKQLRRRDQFFADVTRAARRELAALAALNGREWDEAPGAWIERQSARFDRWSQCILLMREEWDALAAEDITASVDRYQDTQQELRNPFHPRVLDRLDDVVPFVMEHRGIRGRFADVVDLLPPLAERLSPEGIEAFIRAEVARRQAVAADPVLIVHRQPADQHPRRPEHRAGEVWLIVEHPASGLRARFQHHPDDPGREGVVFAKPYKIESIDPTRREDPEDRAPRWRDYAGLGIGTRLYLRAAQELPDVRWGGISVSEYAEPLRAKLHAADPWRWRSRTCTCAEGWSALTRETVDQVAHTPSTDD